MFIIQIPNIKKQSYKYIYLNLIREYQNTHLALILCSFPCYPRFSLFLNPRIARTANNESDGIVLLNCIMDNEIGHQLQSDIACNSLPEQQIKINA